MMRYRPNLGLFRTLLSCRFQDRGHDYSFHGRDEDSPTAFSVRVDRDTQYEVSPNFA